MPTEPLLSCKTVVVLVDDYLDDELPDEFATQIRQHLAQCPECRAFFNSYSEAIRLAQSARAEGGIDSDVPEGFSERIIDALKKRP